MNIRTFIAVAAAVAVIIIRGAACVRADVGAMPVAVASTAADVAPMLARARAAGRCWAADAEYGHGGAIASGTTTAPLPDGRYRLHVLLARSPLGDVYSNAVAVRIQCGDSSVTPPALTFAVADEFVDIPLVVSLDGSRALTVQISWSVPPDAESNKQKYTDPATLDPENIGQATDDGGFQMPSPAADGSIVIADLPKVPVAVAVCATVVEALPPIAAEVETNKITYRVGEPGLAAVTLTNVTDRAMSASLACSIASGIDDITPVGSQTVDLGPGASKTVKIPFDTKALKWGAEFRATVRAGSGPSETSRAVFAVHDDFWAISMLAAQGPDNGHLYKDPSVAEAKVEEWRKSGQTGFEMFFWAPDDFGDFTPKTEDWLSGQTLYQESVTGTKNLIKAAHDNGMYATVYSNLWGSDGVSGFELMRKHPDWYGWASDGAEWLEMWDRRQNGKLPQFEQWVLNGIVGDTGPIGQAAIAHHAAELVASHNEFGWDGVRYDSYDSTPWVQWATKLTRSLVEKQVPNFGFGYNSAPKSDAKRGALDTMVGGGGMEMVEYVDPESYTTLAGYTAELSACRDLVWAHGGNLGPIYRDGSPQGIKAGLAVPLDAVYITSAMLATGSHAYYSPLEHSLGRHAEFALRYGEFIWDNRLVPVKEPDSVIRFGDGADPLLWQTLARTGVVDGHYRLILHLLNAPPNYRFFTDDALKTLLPQRNVPLTLNLPAGSKVLSVYDLCPIRGLDPVALTPKTEGNAVQITVPLVRFYDIIVIDFSGPKGLS